MFRRQFHPLVVPICFKYEDKIKFYSKISSLYFTKICTYDAFSALIMDKIFKDPREKYFSLFVYSCLDEAPISGTVVELGRLLDLEICDLGGQGDALVDDGVAAAEQEGDDPVELLRDEDDSEEDHPLPEAGRVQDQQPPVQPVVQVREVEHLR